MSDGEEPSPESHGAPPSSAPAEMAATAGSGSAQQWNLIERLRAGDESAFAMLVSQYYPAMLRIASLYVSNRTTAEDVIQETWVGVLQGLKSFEGRSSLKTWIFRILVNIAKTRAQRESRSIPFSSLADFTVGDDEPAVDANRFLPADHPQWPGHWASPPVSWESIPEERLLSRETGERISQAIEALPAAQRAVITLRDVEGWTADEVCDHLGLSDGNQRVLLHRARSKVRQALEEYVQTTM